MDPLRLLLAMTLILFPGIYFQSLLHLRGLSGFLKVLENSQFLENLQTAAPITSDK